MLRLATFAAIVALTGVLIAEEPPDRVQLLATQMAERLDGWTLQHVDDKPSVQVDESKGYRVVLRRRYKVYPDPDPPQQRAAPRRPDQPFEGHHEDWEVVVLPLTDRVLPANMSELSHVVEFRKRDTQQHLRPVYLGTHVDYALFTLATLPEQERLRDELNLSGGDDRIQLAVDGLSVEDKGTNTANSMPHILKKFGDAALPYLDRAIEEVDDPRRHIQAIGKIPTRRATQRLMQLYRDADPKKQEAAASALAFGWHRDAARPVYVQMIRDRRRLREIATLAAEFGWAESIEPLEQAVTDPPTLFDYYAAFRALRRLQGHPVPEQIEQASSQIKKAGYASGKPVDQEAVDRGVQQILDSQDQSAALVVGLELALYRTKGDVRAVNAAGLQMLRQLPTGPARETVGTLAKNLDNEDHRKHVERLLEDL